MKVLQINSFFSVGGPPRIVKGIYDTLLEKGHDCIVAAGREKPYEGMKAINIGTQFDKYVHLFTSRVIDNHGFSSKNATKKLIDEIQLYNPDIIHIHNLHGYYLNVEILFDYIKRINIPIVWTLHDCWAFTGHCSYFDRIGCKKWESGCYKCSLKTEYPRCDIIDASFKNYNKKKYSFTNINNLTIVTPSNWLAGLVRKSFLKEYPHIVIPNGIDLEMFYPNKGDFREKYNIKDKLIVLGVAQNWDNRKGLNTFIELNKCLSNDFQIVLVGLSDKQMKDLPKRILAIGKTKNVSELIQIYSDSNVFVNPTIEDNFPTVNLEALACGIPVITYDTGGSAEMLDKSCGIAIEKGNINELNNSIIKVCNNKIFRMESCLSRAQSFNKLDRYNEYIELYKDVLKMN